MTLVKRPMATCRVAYSVGKDCAFRPTRGNGMRKYFWVREREKIWIQVFGSFCAVTFILKIKWRLNIIPRNFQKFGVGKSVLMRRTLERAVLNWFFAFLLIISAITPAMAGGDSPRIAASKGILDCRDWDFAKDYILSLNGEWEFYWNELLSPLDLKVRQHFSKKYVQFPSLWSEVQMDGKSLPNQGYATYRLVIQTKKNLPLLGLKIANVYTSYKLFLNGKIFAENGKVGKTKKETIPHWIPVSKSFSSEDTTIELVLQIANFHHSKGGIKSPILLGNSDEIIKKKEHSLYLDLILFGTILMAGVFFLSMFFLIRKDPAILFFSLFCLAYSYRIVGFGEQVLHRMLPNLNWELTIRMEYISMYLSCIFFLAFTKTIFPNEINKYFIRSIQAISIFLALLALFSPATLFTQTVNFFMLVIGFSLCYGCYVFIAAFKNKRREAKYAILSILILFAVMSFTISDYFGWVTANEFVMFLGYSGFFFFQSLILSDRMASYFKKLAAEARAGAEVKTQFLATMSHEIRTPMNGVIGMTSLLSQTRLSKEQKKFVETIRISGENLMAIINEILDFSKIEKGKMQLEELPFSLEETIEQIFDLFSAKAQKKGLLLFYDIDPAVPKTVIGDAIRIKQILTNLINNSLKFTERGEVIVRVSLVRNHDLHSKTIVIGFDVEDTGIGIPEEKQNLLFHHFSQVDATITRKYGGTGLGLAICKKLVQMMNGTIGIVSAVEKGTTISFTLELKAATEAVAKPVSLRSNLKKAFVHSKDSTFRSIVTKQLRCWGVQVLKSVNNPQNGHIDVMIVDKKLVEKVGTFKHWLRYHHLSERTQIILWGGNSQQLKSDFELPYPVELLHSPLSIISLRALLKKELKLKKSKPLQIAKPAKSEELNLTKAKPIAAERPANNSGFSDLSKEYPLRILIAEDNPINLQLIVFLLKKMGYIPDTVGNGKEALDALERQDYDMILMDIQMPEMDGLEATRKIVEKYAREERPFIIAMTANALPEDKRKCYAAGMDDFASKPLKPGIVKEIIQKWGKKLQKVS